MNKRECKQKILAVYPGMVNRSFEYITTGSDDDVVIVGKKNVFTFPKNKPGCREKFVTEINILPLFQPIVSLSIPKLIYIAPDISFGMYKYVPGVPFTKKLALTLTARQKTAAAKKIATFLSALHSFSANKAKKHGVTDAWSERDARSFYLKRARTVFKTLSYDFGIVQRLFRKYPLSETTYQAVVHQDFTSDHILFDPAKKKIIVLLTLVMYRLRIRQLI